VPFTVTADLSASQQITHNDWGLSVDFGVPATAGTPLLPSAEYTAPGIYNFRAAVWSGALSTAASGSPYYEFGRPIIALGGHDLLCDGDSIGRVMPLAKAFGSGETFPVYLTILDTVPRIMVGPASNSDPSASKVPPPESIFFGILRYENGTFSALNAANSYLDAPGKHGAGTYRLSFSGNFTNPMTYDVSVAQITNEPCCEYCDTICGYRRVAAWTGLPRRGYATSIDRYAAWSSRSQAAVLHMDRWADNSGSTGINTAAGTKTRESRKAPIAAARKNGISLSIPVSTQPAQIEVFNAKGALVRRVSANARTRGLVIPVKSRGLYLYRVSAGNKIFTGSVVVR